MEREGKDNKRRGGARGGRPDTAAGGERKRGQKTEGGAIRPQTAAPRDEKALGEGKRGGGDGAGRGGRRQAANGPDPSSFQYKYKNRERGEGAKKVKLDGPLTAETELPKMIPKEEQVERPNRDDFDKDMNELEAKAQAQLKEVRGNREKRRAIIDGSKGTGDLGAMGEEIGGAISSVKKHRAAKRNLIDGLKTANERQRILEAQRAQLTKQIPDHLRDERDVAKEIKHKKKRYETQSLAAAEERAILKEIDVLKRALTDLQEYNGKVAPELDALKAKKLADQKELDKIKKLIEEADVKIDAAKSKADETRGVRDGVREEADKFHALIEEQSDEVTKIFDQKDKRREAYFEKLLKFDEQQEYIGQLRIYMSQQKRMRAQDDDRDKRVDDRRKQIESISNKNTKAIETCAELIQHCIRLKTKFGLNEVDADEVAAKAQKELKEQQRMEQVQAKLNDGRLMMAEAKKDKDEVLVIGGTGGGKGKKNRNRNKKTDEAT